MNVYNKVLTLIRTLDGKSIQLMKNVSFSFIIRGAALIVSLFTMPAYMNFFPNQAILGMWFTAISLLSWILTFDLGVGNGLRNQLVGPLIKKDIKEVKVNISSAYISVGFLAIILSILSYIFIPIFNWNKIFNISIEIIDTDTLLFMVRTLVIGILLQFWLKLITSILYALQKSAIIGLLTLTSSILMLIFTLVARTNDIMYNVKILSIAYIFTSNIPYLVITILLFSKQLKNYRPNIRYFSKISTKKIVTLGGTFFYLQILTMIMFNTNEFLITWLINPKEVVTFQIYNKIFTLIGSLFNLALAPVWSGITEAIVKEDYAWVKNLYKKLNAILLIIIPIEIILVVLMPVILNIWLGDNTIVVSLPYSITFAVYNILFMKVSIDTSVIAGLGKLRIQAYALTFSTLIKIILSFILTYYMGTWISIIIANILALIPYIIIEYFDIRSKITVFERRNLLDIKRN